MDRLDQTLYDEIRRLAAGQLRRERGQRSIGATDLAHEALERALRQGAAEGVERAEVLRRCAHLCRQVLVDHARARGRRKRGDGQRPFELEIEPAVDVDTDGLDLLALDEALTRLAELEPRHAGLVELRFFGGRSMAECADTLGVSLSAAEKDWRKARAWLELELSGGGGPR